MFVHIVLFHLKDELSEEIISKFEGGLNSLRKIETIKEIYIGKPLKESSRPEIRNDYYFNLTIIFENVEAHDSYQTDPIHKAFVNNFSIYWKGIEIIDSN